MDGKQRESVQTEGRDAPAVASPSQPASHLPPKGACWYCDKPLDAVRRFCGKTCGMAYAEETQYNP